MMLRWSSEEVRAGLARMARRWGWALAACTAGLGGVAVWASEELEAHAQLLRQLQTLKDQASAARPPTSAGQARASDATALLDRLPAVQGASGLWLALQQGLQQQGLRVQSLKPLPLQEGEPLSSQALAMRWQGRYADMVSAWASLADAGPVWTLDRLSVTPGGSAGQLQWDGVWRVWLRPGPAHAQAWPAGWQTAGAALPLRWADPFGVEPPVGHTAAAAPVAGASEADVWSDNPRHWPLAQMRLLGVWQQGGRTQAVLAAGPHWAVLAEGARIALEGYRIQTIHPDAVALQALKAPGDVHTLRLQGGAP
jgi:hypothetical protein